MRDGESSHAEQQQLKNQSRFDTGLNADDELIRTAAKVMNDEEKAELAEWKRERVATGEYGTIDWPGWDSVISRIQG